MTMRIPLNKTTTSYTNSLIVKQEAGTLHFITGYNSGPDQFIQIHDSVLVPSDGSIPSIIFIIPAQSNFSFDLGVEGRYFSNGIIICNSTTGPTKTIGSADCWFDVQYK